MTSLTTVLTSLDGTLVGVLVAALVYAETATLVGMILPTSTALLLTGGLVSTGTVSATWLVPLVVLAAIAGDCTAWVLGRRLGGRVRTGPAGRLVADRHWVRADSLIERRGALTLVGARWLGFARAVVPMLSGASRMPFRRFLVADTAACLLWVGGIVLLGYVGAAGLLTASGSLAA